MPDLNEEYEKKLRQRIALANRKIRKYYDSAIHTLTPYIDKVKYNGQVFSLSDHPQLKARIDAQLKQMHGNIYTTTVNSIKESWKLSNKKNDRLVDKRLASNNPTKRMREILYDPNLGALDQFTKRRTNGLTLSDRVWNAVEPFRYQLEAGLGLGITTGKSAKAMAKELKQYLWEPDRLYRRVRDSNGKLKLSNAAKAYHPGQGVYRSIVKNTQRLTRSENNMAYRTADHERWKNLPFVIGIEVRLSAQHPRYDICDVCAGRYPKDFKFVGWHPQCLCHAIPVMMNDDDYSRLQDSLLGIGEFDPASVQHVTTTPEGFKQFVRENIARIKGWKSTPYWIKDNTSFVKEATKKLQASKLPVDYTKLDLSEYLSEVRQPAYKDIFPELIDEEKAAIHGYTGSEYRTLNAYLRGMNVSEKRAEMLDNYRNLLNNALDSIPEKHAGIVYRGSRLDDDWIALYRDAFKTKKKVEHAFFTSTSINAGSAFAGNAKFTISSKTGRKIQSVSKYESEKEVLFKAGTKFKVVKMARRQDKWYIHLEES